MQIHIKTQFKEVTVELADLTRNERGALAGLLGLSGKRKEIFKALRALPRYKKIKQEQVWALCPKGNRFETEFTVEDVDADWGPALPDAEVYPKVRTLGGYCSACRQTHAISKDTVVVSLVEGGVRFTNIYEVNHD
jgi:hypothetical protein